VGLIVLGAYQTIHPGRKTATNCVNLYDDCFIPKLKEWVRVIHDNGCKVAAQLATYTYLALKGPDSTPETVGPSAIELPREGTHPAHSLAEYLPQIRELTVQEISIVEEAVSDAAARAQEAGFDAIEFQCVGGNLFNRFVHPFTNQRTDHYGGSIENRMRIVTETIASIKKKVGTDFPITSRICGDDLTPWSIGLAGWQELAPHFEKAGINALNIYPVWHESRAPKPQMSVPRGAFVYIAEGIKNVVSIPVIAAVRINDPLMAEQIIAEGKADMVSMARPCISDPEMPNKAKEGRLDDIIMCTACCRCYDDMLAGGMMGCSVNARAGKEAEYKITPAKKPKKVLIVGGGPAGMEAARVAALRGHRVTLYEKKYELGGQLLSSVIPPYKDEWHTTIDYYNTQLRKLKVDVRCGQDCTTRTIEEEKPDAVIVATGANHCIPDIPGINGKNVTTAIEVLTGQTPVGQNVVIVGGGSVGCETAEFLAQKGKKVIILEMLKTIGADIGPMNRFVVIDRLVEAGIRLETSACAEEITEKGVRIKRSGWRSEFFEADSVVIAAGMEPVDSTVKEPEGKAPKVYKVGDCVAPAQVKEAIESGFLAGAKV
jgi:2,4-dienoyl-CoA reductase-like NADH-dependent reductase (Old Yellow Enzyme family)/thioredoxin reductase